MLGQSVLPNLFKNAAAIGYRKKWLAVVICLQIASTVFEALGLASIIPVLQFMKGGNLQGLTSSSTGWAAFVGVLEQSGLPINLATVLLFAFAAIVIRQCFTYAQIVFAASVQSRLVLELRRRGFSGYVSAREEVRTGERLGDIVNDLTTELQNAVSCVSSAARVIAYSIMLLGYFGLAFVLSPELSFVAIGIAIAVGIGLLILTRSVGQLGKDVTRANQNVVSFLVERLSSARLVRLCGMETPEKREFGAFLDRQRNKVLALQKIMALFQVLLEPIALLFGFALLYIAVEQQMVGFEALILFFFILMRLVPVIKEMFGSRNAYIGTLGSLETVRRRLQLLEGCSELDGGLRTLDRVAQGIQFDNVSYTYPGNCDRPALKDVVLNIPAGKLVAVVGPSGAGKSTFVDLVPRLRSVCTGEIRIDGTDLRDFCLVSLRKAISYAPQTPQLFDVSAAEHIKYGKFGATDAEVREAARLAQALDFIEALPEGFNTKIGPGGGRLSGGQRRRLDLARALVRRAPILILDEPASNLDAESELLFQRAIRQIRRDTKTTIIMVSHNLQPLSIVDQIVVLVGGKVEAVGTHDQLVERVGWYGQAYRGQRGDHGAIGDE